MRRGVAVAAAAVLPLGFVGAAVAPQLSGRLTGEDYRMEVRPLDPVDPFRGAYVTLDYPGLQGLGGTSHRGDVFVPLVERDGYWVGASVTRSRPDGGPYLSCRGGGWTVDCGIGSWFTSQDRAAELERRLVRDGGVATVRIDDRGHATVVDLR